jgi:uncharacterized protein YaeQ
VVLKPTIYKFKIALSDLNRNYYEALNFTVAQHPSETQQRLMARVLSFCINAREDLVFGKGLSDVEEPDIWARTLDDQISLWIEVGEPSVDRVKKATRIAQAVSVYSFNSKSDVWWNQSQDQFKKLAVSVFRFDCNDIQVFAGLLQRTMEISITISGDSAYVAAEMGECEVHWQPLQVS